MKPVALQRQSSDQGATLAFSQHRRKPLFWKRSPRFRWRLGLFLVGVWLVGLLALPWGAIGSSPAAATPTELRGVWLTNIDSPVLFSQRNLHNALERLDRLNFNTIYPTVWNWGYTLYPSEVAAPIVGRSQLPDSGFRGRDALAETIEKGHELGMAVIPWFEFGLMAPAYSELVQRHPDWVTRRRDGSEIVMEGRFPRVWLNPAHPEVQDFILALVQEIVTRYDVDGLQLDDHFGMPVELGYDPYTVALYRQTHQGQSPPSNPRDSEWMRWRAAHVSRLMERVFETVKQAKPRAVVSLSPNVRNFSYNNFLQDWSTWERAGYVEELIVQIYRDNLDSFQRELNQPDLQAAREHIPVSIGILAGLRQQLNDERLIQQKVDVVRDRQFAGVSFFFYETLDRRDGLLETLFPDPAPRPHLPDLQD
ncbi:glycoside hydrolase family 10 protein [Vacuolonema iberomarrocanum]|uniref:glycoside hydrolase family 10 protein n=1 Tax=Vacuolonema iberomarrocanum TaxID=3454632 RepID=UPI003F6DD0AD